MAKKNQVSQANKLKREERLTEIDSLLQNNKELQEQIMQKLDEARALSATSEVHWHIHLQNNNTIFFSVRKLIQKHCGQETIFCTCKLKSLYMYMYVNN